MEIIYKQTELSSSVETIIKCVFIKTRVWFSILTSSLSTQTMTHTLSIKHTHTHDQTTTTQHTFN